MNAMQDVERIVADAAAAHISASRVKRVTVEPFVNWVDQDGLRATIVIADDDPLPFDGATLLGILMEVSDRLKAAGEPRTATISYATEEDLAHSGDPEV